MKLSNLILPIVFTGFLLLLALPFVTPDHNHVTKQKKLNANLQTEITLCIQEDTMQVTKLGNHIDYE